MGRESCVVKLHQVLVCLSYIHGLSTNEEDWVVLLLTWHCSAEILIRLLSWSVYNRCIYNNPGLHMLCYLGAHN